MIAWRAEQADATRKVVCLAVALLSCTCLYIHNSTAFPNNYSLHSWGAAQDELAATLMKRTQLNVL